MTGRCVQALLIGAVLACSPATGRQADANAPAAAVKAEPVPAPAVKADPFPASIAAGLAPATAPAPVPAAAAPRPLTAPVLPQPMAAASAGSLIQTILALTLVLGLLAVFAWGMKRFGPKAQGGAAGLRIVGALNLGGRERIMVVEVGDQWIVVGAAPGRVNALATMPKQEAAPAAPATLHPHAPAAGSFSEWLKQTIDKRNAQ